MALRVNPHDAVYLVTHHGHTVAMERGFTAARNALVRYVWGVGMTLAELPPVNLPPSGPGAVNFAYLNLPPFAVVPCVAATYEEDDS